jgi:hypothetical protein
MNEASHQTIDFARLEKAGRSRFADEPLSSGRRWEQILMLAQLGHTLEQSSPHPDDLQRVRDCHEAAWRVANVRLFHNAGL